MIQSQMQNDQSIKADAGKPRLSLVPPEIIKDIARVREYGLQKYGECESWRKVEPERYRDAMFRHLLAYNADPASVDEESGLPHLWHLACNVAFLCEIEKPTEIKTKIKRSDLTEMSPADVVDYICQNREGGWWREDLPTATNDKDYEEINETANYRYCGTIGNTSNFTCSKCGARYCTSGIIPDFPRFSRCYKCHAKMRIENDTDDNNNNDE